MKKFLKKKDGFAGVDISISMIIILVFIPTIFGIVYNIGKTNSDIKRKVEAINISTNILEIIKSEKYLDVSASSTKLNEDINSKYQTSSYKNTDKEESGYNYIYYLANGENDEHYQIQVGIKNYYPTEDSTQDLIKLVKVRVFYVAGSDIKDIDIATTVLNT